MIIGSDITAYRVTIGLFYHKICGGCSKKIVVYSSGLFHDIIFFTIMYLEKIKKCILEKYKSHCNLIVYYMLLFSLLIVCGDIETNPGPGGTPEIQGKTLSIFHCNIRSLRNKLNYIIDIIDEFDIVFFTETHLNESFLHSDIYLPDFEFPVRKDRNSNGGGIIMYYKNYINIKRRIDLENILVESMWFELKTKISTFLININYRSERQAPVYFWQYFDVMLRNALDENNNIICLGDLNNNFMSDLPQSLKDIIFINGLVNIISKPTHFNTTGSDSLLDPILVTDSIRAIDTDTIPIDRNISDHDGTYVTIESGFSNTKTFNRTIWDYKRGDYQNMKTLIEETNWKSLISDASDIHVACTNFTNTFLDIASRCIPTREITVRVDDKVWYDSNSDEKRESETDTVKFISDLKTLLRKGNSNNNGIR